MKLILKKPWNYLDPGSEVDITPEIARLLAERGIVDPPSLPGAGLAPTSATSPTPARMKDSAQGLKVRKK